MKDLKLKAIFVVFLMTAIVWSSVLNYVGAEYGAPESSGFTSGNWCIEYDDEIERNNETIIVNGSLIINNSGILKLSNVNLKINSIENNIYKIWVKPGGTLFLSSTNICSYNQNYLYKFIVEGYMYMENCTINNVWGSSNNPQSGVQLNSDAEIYYSTINGSSGTGIYVNESNPTIQNTVISNCHYGIYCQSPYYTFKCLYFSKSDRTI